jgi:hypothetical protein
MDITVKIQFEVEAEGAEAWKLLFG